MSTKFEAVDNAILAVVRERGSVTFSSIWQNSGVQAAALDARGETYRTTDSRLQSLRRRGLIAFNSKTGWSIAKAETA